MIDTHAHVHDGQFDDDREATIARARAAGVEAIVTIGCDLGDSERAIRTAETFGLLATIGIHPHEAKDAPADIAAAFERLRAGTGAPIVAIGETGLDYHYDHSPAADQRRVLRAQIAYARAAALPLVFHQREAYDDFVGILRETWDRTTMRGVIHCFTGDTAQARTFVDEFGLLLGIGGVVTFKTAGTLRDAVRAVGLASIVMETDCPYLAPVPYRGKRNEPAFVLESAGAVAAVLGVGRAAVAAATSATAGEFFRLR
ncbi:MAG TPA: TatD family hydrolase [Candidatus Lustribacter sp.]